MQVQKFERERRLQMPFDYGKLKGRIIEVFGNQSNFAKRMEMSERTLSLKLNGKVAWKQNEMLKAISELNLTKSDIQVYFFKEKVQNI